MYYIRDTPSAGRAGRRLVAGGTEPRVEGVSDLRVLFIGGSGIISSACSRLAVERGIELFVLNRGATQLRPLPEQATVLRGDIRDPVGAAEALGGREFDAVVDWVAYTPAHVQADIDLFRGRAGQYVFISSASAYADPGRQRIDPRIDAVMDKLIGAYRTVFRVTTLSPSSTRSSIATRRSG
jgi:nucleoside-diphosphate-sugar epimerase